MRDLRCNRICQQVITLIGSDCFPSEQHDRIPRAGRLGATVFTRTQCFVETESIGTKLDAISDAEAVPNFSVLSEKVGYKL